MNRRVAFFVVFAVFIPIVLWYATTYSGLPSVTFREAAAMADSVPKVLVRGTVTSDHKPEEGDEGLTFYMKDESGAEKRVVYDGDKKYPPEKLSEAEHKGETIRIAGHVCSDVQGERFHAKNIYLSN